jgi:hypothetical protein
MAIVLLVIAIIAAFVVPQVINYMRAYRIGVAARNVATTLQRARYLATSNNTRAGITVEQANRVDITQYDPEGKEEPKNQGTLLLPEGIAISTSAPIKIDFDGRGVITPMPRESPTIRLKGANGYFATVSVSLTGQVTVLGPNREP